MSGEIMTHLNTLKGTVTALAAEGGLTCTESDAFADLYATFGFQGVAYTIRDNHAQSDEEGDEHYEG